MSKVLMALFAVLTILFAGTALAEKNRSKAVELFNGKNLDGWECFVIEPGVEMEDVWSVRDGILVCKGEPLGFLHTKKDYESYKLVVEWRWAPGGEPGNSGVLMRVAGDPPSFLPKCVEAQLKHDSAGDIWAFYGFEVRGPEDRFVDIEHEKLGRLRGVKRMRGAEKPAGKWNKYEITLDGEKLELVINGQKVNAAKGLTVVPGKIGLQSEGGEIHFRKVKLIPIAN